MGEEAGKPFWRRLEFVAVSAASATFLGLLIGQSAETYVAQLPQPPVETAKIQPRFNAIDYATTASIKSGTVIIGPCDTHKP